MTKFPNFRQTLVQGEKNKKNLFIGIYLNDILLSALQYLNLNSKILTNEIRGRFKEIKKARL